MTEQTAALTCFVIGPIGDRLAPTGSPERTKYVEAAQLWETVLEPACAEFSLQAIRADKIASPGEIPDQIFRLLRDADIVIADLTGGNPNVMYELGLRHTRGKITIPIGEIERLPFDINTIRTIRFRRTEYGLVEARQMLAESLQAALGGAGTPVSATRIWAEDGAGLSPSDVTALSSQSDGSEPDADEEPGFIDILAAGEAAVVALGPQLVNAGKLVEELSERATLATSEIQASDASGKGFAGRLLVAKALAADLDEIGTRFENQIADYVEGMAPANSAMEFLISLAATDTPEPELVEMLSHVVTLAKQSKMSIESSEALAAGYRETMKISKDLRAPVRRIVVTVNRYIEATNLIVGWGDSIEALPYWQS